MGIAKRDPKVPAEKTGKSPIPDEFMGLLSVATKGYGALKGPSVTFSKPTPEQPPVAYMKILNVGGPRIFGKGGMRTPTKLLGPPSPNPYKGAK